MRVLIQSQTGDVCTCLSALLAVGGQRVLIRSVDAIKNDACPGCSTPQHVHSLRNSREHRDPKQLLPTHVPSTLTYQAPRLGAVHYVRVAL